MPRLSSRNEASTGYMRSWFDDNRTILQECSSGICKVGLSDGGTLQNDVEVIHVYARDGKWVAEVPGKLIGSWGEIHGGALGPAIDPIGPDGSLVYKRLRDSYGPWGFVNGPSFGGDCATTQNLGGGKAVWTEDRILKSNFGHPKEGTLCYGMRIKGADYLYQSVVYGTLVLNDRVIGPAGDYFRPDFSRSGDTFYVVWSPNEGESIVLSRELTVAELMQLPRVGERPPPPPPPPPDKEPEKPMQAPNKIEVVQRIMNEHPEIDRLKDGERGKITDFVVLALGGRPWGRKDRDQNPDNNNNSDDALTYWVGNDRFEIYDIISGTDGSATWDYKGTFRNGENGYFREVEGSLSEPDPVEPDEPQEPTDPPAACKCDEKLDVIIALLGQIIDNAAPDADLRKEVAAVKAQLDRGFEGSTRLASRMTFKLLPVDSK